MKANELETSFSLLIGIYAQNKQVEKHRVTNAFCFCHKYHKFSVKCVYEDRSVAYTSYHYNPSLLATKHRHKTLSRYYHDAEYNS